MAEQRTLSPATINNNSKESADEAYKKKQKATADRILSFGPTDYSQILDSKEPISETEVYKSFEYLSNILSPECNDSGYQYTLAQDAHDSKHVQ